MMSEIINHNELKELSRKELLALLPSDLVFKVKPWKHQIAPLVCSLAYSGFFNTMDLGTGKSAVAVNMCAYLAKSKPIKVLVICLCSAVENWADEFKIHSNMKSACLRGTPEERWTMLKGTGAFIINYEGLRNMLSMKVVKNDKMKMVPDPRAIRKFLSFKFDILVLDESHKCKNPDSLNYKVINQLQKRIDKRTLLTGTPFGNTLLGVWPQYYIVDRGLTYGPNYYGYRRAYFEDKGFWGPDWKVTKSGKKKIEEKLFNRAIRYSEDEVTDLPGKVYRTVKYRLSNEQDKAYDDAYEGLDGMGGTIENKTLEFRQICGGAIKRTGKIFKKNPKLDAVKETIISVIEKDNKAVVFYEFKLEFEILSKMLKKNKIKFNYINGQSKDAHAEYTEFNTNSKSKVCLVQPKAGGASINLIGGSYCLFFSNGSSIIERKQCEKRVHRGGQKRRCFFYDFVGLNTIEIQMLKAIEEGKNFFSEVMDKENFKKMLRDELKK